MSSVRGDVREPVDSLVELRRLFDEYMDQTITRWTVPR